MSNKYCHLPSDLHGQGRISMETRGATLCSDWPGEDQRLPTTRDQPPKQEHLPLTLHCKCSQTERTHIASSKPQPGIRKSIAHCAPTLSSDTLHYQKMSPRQQVTLPGELHMITWENTGIFRVTSRSIEKRAFHKWQAKLVQRKSRCPGATSTVGQTSISREKPLQIQGVSEETSRLSSCQPALSILLFRKDGYPHRLKKAHSTLARNVTETTSNFTRGTA